MPSLSPVRMKVRFQSSPSFTCTKALSPALLNSTMLSGTVSTLSLPRECQEIVEGADPKPAPCGKTLDGGFRFGVVRLMDEPANGTWRLSVADENGAPSTLTRWSLKVYGH